MNGLGGYQRQMSAVFYPGWGISPRGRGFVVTEEFRTHTVLTMLASLGGLWTILSALFSWLFGRSLLFPLFGKNMFRPFHAPLCSGSTSTPSGNKPISPFGLMGKVLSNRRRKEIQWQIQNMGLNQIIRDFVIDLSPFTVPSDKPTNEEVHHLQIVWRGCVMAASFFYILILLLVYCYGSDSDLLFFFTFSFFFFILTLEKPKSTSKEILYSVRITIFTSTTS